MTRPQFNARRANISEAPAAQTNIAPVAIPQNDKGVPAGRIYRAKDMFADPHFAAREAIVRLSHPDLGEIAMQNVFPKLSASPGSVRTVGPALGADNDRIYRGLLGLGDDELDRLSKAGVI